MLARGVAKHSLAHWHSRTKVGQGRERPGRQTVCVHHYHASSAICEQCVKSKTLQFPVVLVTFAFFIGPKKVRRAWADKESLISHLNNDKPNRWAISARPSRFSNKPSNTFSLWKQSRCGTFTPIEFFALWANFRKFHL